MRILCYKSRSDQEVREQLWQLIKQGSRGWISDRVTHMLFFLPEDLVTFALLIDSGLEPCPKLDHIV